MIKTRLTELLRIAHPIGLGGMGSVNSPALTAAVSEAGGLGAIGGSHLSGDQMKTAIQGIRALTSKPFAVNFLIFDSNKDAFEVAMAERPPVIAYAWPRKEQDLKPWFDRAHAMGAKITFMASSVLVDSCRPNMPVNDALSAASTLSLVEKKLTA